MKPFFLFLSLITGTAQGQIFADFSTTLGDYTVQLDYTNSPLTVANFMILAEGSRPWIDSTSGETKINTPFYEGITFHRVIDDFIIQAGSPNGQGTDGPGYRFQDETDNGLVFGAPYLLAMANSGPNSNGSQFFITEETPINSSDRPLTDVVINSVTIRRVGAAAEAFDEFAEELPVVSTLDLDISDDGLELLLSQPGSTTLQAYRSTHLLNWTPITRFLDFSQSSANLFPLPEISPRPIQEFYRGALVTWPTSVPAPSTYRGRTLTFMVGENIFIVSPTVDGTPTEGTITINDDEQPMTEFREKFTSPYDASFLVFSDAFVPLRFRLTAESATSGDMEGTAFTTPFSQSISGPYTLTTP